MPQPCSPQFSSLDDVVTIPAPSSADPGGSNSESYREEEVRKSLYKRHTHKALISKLRSRPGKSGRYPQRCTDRASTDSLR